MPKLFITVEKVTKSKPIEEKIRLFDNCYIDITTVYTPLIKKYYLLVVIFMLQISWSSAVMGKEKPSEESVRESIEKQLQVLNAPKLPSEASPQKKAGGSANVPEESSAQEDTQKKIDAEFSLSRENNEVKATINFDNGVPYFAVFRLGSDWFITLSYPADNKMTDWKTTEFPEIERVTTIENETSFSYRLQFNKVVFPKIHFDNQKDTLTVTFGGEIVDKGALVTISQPKNMGDVFSVRLRNACVDVEVNLDDSNKTLWVICADDSNRPISLSQYPEFDLLESYQGVAFLIKSDDLNYVYARKVAEISKQGGLANSFSSTPSSKDSGLSIFADFEPSVAPHLAKETLKRLVSGDSRVREGMYLTWLYLGQGLAQESAEIADQLLSEAPDLKILPFWRALRGLAALMRFHYQRSQDFLNFVKGDREVDCWWNIAEAAQHTYSNPVNIPKILRCTDTLALLPTPIRERLRNDILEVGIINGDKMILTAYGNTLGEPLLAMNRPLYNVAMAVLDLDVKHPASGDSLKTLVKDDPLSKASVLASFEYLKFLRATKGIEVEDELKQLDRLRYLWRGDLFEYTICKYLAQRYMEEHKYAQVLPLLRKTIKYFNKDAYADKLPDIMQQALIDYFNQKSPPVLEMLSIFQEYTSIAPDDARGDAIMIKATNVLVNLELYDQASSLLADYLNQKVKNGDQIQERKNKIYYRMAVASILGNKPDDCLKYLEGIKTKTGQLDDDGAILRSEAYLRLRKTDKALQSLSNVPVQQFQKASIYFGDKNWAEAINIYKMLADQSSGASDQIKENSIINLVLCYAIQGDQTSLSEVKTKFKDFMAKRKGNQIFDFLTAPDAKINLAQLTSLRQVDSFAERLKSVFS